MRPFEQRGHVEQRPHKTMLEQLNLLPIAAMSVGWSSPMLVFWLQVCGPLRPAGMQVTSGLSLVALLVMGATTVLPWWLPNSYFQPQMWERRRRVYERFGIRTFRRFATNGDLIVRQVQRRDPAYRVLPDQAAWHTFIHGSCAGEKAHLALLLLGVWTTIYAARNGWLGWVIILTGGNILFNLYPIMLQRYNRARVARMTTRLRPATRAPRHH